MICALQPENQSFLVTSVVAEEARGVGVQLARLLILRARRSYNRAKTAPPGSGHDDEDLRLSAGLSELRYVLVHIFRQLRRYSETEARARCVYEYAILYILTGVFPEC